jgi:hypothetical protein
MIDLIHRTEATRPLQHPVGMSGAPIGYDALAASPADWIAPPTGGPAGRFHPAPADGRKVHVIDTDHIEPWDADLDPVWPWRAMLRGWHFILMDGYMDARVNSPAEPLERYEAIRRQMGLCCVVAEAIDLAGLEPATDVASSEYALIRPGEEYLILSRGEPHVVVRLRGRFAARWFGCEKGGWVDAPPVDAKGLVAIASPVGGCGVLHLLAGTAERTTRARRRD